MVILEIRQQRILLVQSASPKLLRESVFCNISVIVAAGFNDRGLLIFTPNTSGSLGCSVGVWLLPRGFSTQLQIRGCHCGAFTYLGTGQGLDSLGSLYYVGGTEPTTSGLLGRGRGFWVSY